MAFIWLPRVDCEADTLPDVCLCCGRPATERVAKDFRGTLIWRNPLALVFGEAEGWTARVPMCPRHRNYWRRRVQFIVAGSLLMPMVAATGLLVLIAVEAAGFLTAQTWLHYVNFCLLHLSWLYFVWLGIVMPSGIRATEMCEAGIRLTNVNMEFIRAYNRYDHPVSLGDRDDSR